MKPILLFIMAISLLSCSKNSTETPTPSSDIVFDSIDLNNLQEYNGGIPNYIQKISVSSLDNKKVTLGRALFYENRLSINNTVSCSSCHQQSLGFSDNNVFSDGVNGQTGRHSMRLINARFSDELKFFWDERAASVHDQVIQPIQDETEMGFSGGANPTTNDLVVKLAEVEDYVKTFNFVYGTEEITLSRIQDALAEFVLSIQSFDSKYDSGISLANGNHNPPFSNFTASENRGKDLFTRPPSQGGVGCMGCHRAPEFDIDPNSRNNGVVSDGDLTITRSPSLRDLFNPFGQTTPFMHTGEFVNLEEVIDHYTQDVLNNGNLDNRLLPGGNPQRINLSNQEVEDIINFIKTLSGQDVYTNEKWANPFD